MKILTTVIAFLCISSAAFAHGENKAGPHGGFVRMPGAFHTEVVLDGKSAVKVYLLDIEWKNPSVKRSTVEVLYINKKSSQATCEAKEDYFDCRFPKNIDLTKKGALRVNASREEQKGNPANYDLPLKLKKSEMIMEQH